MLYPIDEESKAKIITLISALIPEAKIYLFGSRARGTNAKWSDVDIALDAGKELDILRVSEINEIMVATNLPYKVDIVDFYTVSPQMRESILRDKIIWKN